MVSFNGGDDADMVYDCFCLREGERACGGGWSALPILVPDLAKVVVGFSGVPKVSESVVM